MSAQRADPGGSSRSALARTSLAAFLRLAWLERAGPRALTRAQDRRLQAIAGLRRADLGAQPVHERADLARAFARDADEPGLVGEWTSGSSGVPLRIVLPPREYAHGLALVVWGFLRSGLRPHARVAQFLVPPDRAWESRRIGPLAWHRLDLRAPSSSAAAALAAVRPDAVYGFPSHLALLAADAEDGRCALRRVPLVVTHGEPLFAAARERIARAFGARVRTSYGATELPRIAWECAAGTLHVLDAEVLLETDPATEEADGTGDLLVTSLYHRRRPLLRYRIGDRARLGPYARCACGTRSTTIVSLAGRCDDMLHLPDGRAVSPRAVCLLEHEPGVRAFRIVQKERGRIEVAVVAGPAFGADGRSRVAALVARGLAGGESGVAIDVQVVDALPRNASGKTPAVVSEVR